MLASIVTAFLRGGDLNRVLEAEVRHRHPLSWNSTAKSKVVCGIAAGVSYLPTVHQDLKPLNILLNEAFEPCFSDFGCSRVVGWNSARITSVRCFSWPGAVPSELRSYPEIGRFLNRDGSERFAWISWNAIDIKSIHRSNSISTSHR
jgi:serine/threonine protein kinase